ncbi:MAG TPA: asparaginase [Actinomycetota bacterium]|nr:asparaginase [Actinomycetota bacterium]
MPVPLARVVRSGLEESIHLGSVVVADAAGRVVASAGDPDRLTYLRSAWKPLQAAACLDRIGDLSLSDGEVAVMAGSHNAEPIHLEAVRSLLERAGLDEGALGCPPDRPIDPEPRGEPPSPLLHNCSGKHAGMLLACARGSLDIASYLDPGHPIQREILELTGAPVAAVGVDGCGAPAAALPLAAFATAFARLPEGLGPSAARVVEAMRAEPYLVAGRGRVCTALMETFPDVVVKVGAEGTAGAALVGRGVGVALKVEDGAGRARDAALVHALMLLEAVDPDALPEFAAPEVLGGGRRVGELRADFSLS